MNTILTVILVGAITFFAFKFHFLLGIAVLAVVAAVVYINIYPNLTVGRANAEFQKKNYKQAFEYYEKAYKSKQRKYTVDVAYAQALLRTGDTDKAMKILNPILSIANLKPEIKNIAKQIRVMINYKCGDLDEAFEEASEMFEDGYTTSNMYCLIGLLMLAKNEPMEDTMSFCEKAYDYDSDNRDNVDNLLLCYLKTGNYTRAKELADDLTAEYPSFLEGWYHSAQVYYNLGNKSKALECLQMAKEADRSFMTTVSEDEIEALELKIS